jgi:hypothetical protein
MGILDEAIREHLELKRQHGADDSELKQLEDQAFGQSERPAAEAPTEFMAKPDLGDEEPQGQLAEEALNQEPPPIRREPAVGMADIQEAPEKTEPEEPASEEEQAAEHEAIPPPVEHSTEERHAIADQPTQMYDVEEEFTSAEAPAPPDADLVAEEMTEARLGPAEPLPPAPEPPVEDDEDDFFDEQRLSDELDQALEAPLDPEPAIEEPEPIADDPEPAFEEADPVATHTEEHDEAPSADKADSADEADSDEDVLEETPDFLEETPEDDELWFEQKPPKDFDFDD